MFYGHTVFITINRAMLERTKIFIFSGLSLSYQSNSEKTIRFEIVANTLIAFAGHFFAKEIENQSCYNVVEIEVSFVSTGHNSDKSEKTEIHVSRSFLAVTYEQICVTIKHFR